MSELTGIDALKRACTILGSQTALAKAVSRTPQAVSELIIKGKRVPAEWCGPIEDATRRAGEVITRHDLRPDLYAPEEARAARAARQSQTTKQEAA